MTFTRNGRLRAQPALINFDTTLELKNKQYTGGKAQLSTKERPSAATCARELVDFPINTEVTRRHVASSHPATPHSPSSSPTQSAVSFNFTERSQAVEKMSALANLHPSVQRAVCEILEEQTRRLHRIYCDLKKIIAKLSRSSSSKGSGGSNSRDNHNTS